MSYVFLDRDGTLIRHVPYLCQAEQVQVLPTVVRGLRELRKAKCTLFLHTNQSGIGRGFFSLADALACNVEMLRQIGLGSALFAGVCLCPEGPDQERQYRKPSPRYAMEIMSQYTTDRSRLCYIGDNITDLLTAEEVGCAGVGVNTGLHNLPELVREARLQQFPIFDNFFEAAMHVVNYFQRADGAE